jgi:hypothetical protein
MIKETEAKEGVQSSMRVTLKTGRRIGTFMILSGVLLATVSMILNRGYELAPFLTMLVSTGAGLITGLGIAKAIQAKSETE